MWNPMRGDVWWHSAVVAIVIAIYSLSNIHIHLFLLDIFYQYYEQTLKVKSRKNYMVSLTMPCKKEEEKDETWELVIYCKIGLDIMKRDMLCV